MSPDSTSNLARAVALRLERDDGAAAAVPEIEASLHQRDAMYSPDKHVVDPVSLGSLIVSIATLAWTVYNDLKTKHAAAPAPTVVARSIRVALTEDAPALDLAQRDRVIAITVDEVTRHDARN